MQNDPILDVLNNLLEYDEILACMVAKHNMISVMPDKDHFKPEIMTIWDIVKPLMDDIFLIIRKYSQAGLRDIKYKLRDYEILFYIIPGAENALVAITPALSSRELIEKEMENARNEIVKIIENTELIN